MASVNSGVEAWRGLVMLLTEFRFLIPGSFEMRKKKSCHHCRRDWRMVWNAGERVQRKPISGLITVWTGRRAGSRMGGYDYAPLPQFPLI